MQENNELLQVRDDVDLETLLEISKNNVLALSGVVQTVSQHSQVILQHGQQINEMSEDIDMLKNDNERRKQNEMVTPSQAEILHRAVGTRVYKLLGIKSPRNKLTMEEVKVRNVYSDILFDGIYGDIKTHFAVSTYREIKSVKYEEAYSFISTWEPKDGLETLKRQAEKNWTAAHPETSLSSYLGVLFIEEN